MPSSSPPAAVDPEEAQRARRRLAEKIRRFDGPWGDEAWDDRVIEAIASVPRHRFMPGVGLAAAYRDAPHPIGDGQTISQPTVVALMTQALRLTGDEKVLEIGTGSGYQAAVLSGLCGHLYSIERIPSLGASARRRLTELGYDVTVRVGDGYQGWPEQAPFDRILLTAAPPELPPALVAQLAEGGILVAPVGDGQQELYRWTKRNGELEREGLGAVRFVPMVEGAPRDEGR